LRISSEAGSLKGLTFKEPASLLMRKSRGRVI